jgi:photosystem II stability/assembly factor-like uncharacterized protein
MAVSPIKRKERNIIMKENLGRAVLIFLVLFFLGACSSDTSDTLLRMIGWTVGQSANGFGTILHTDNGGKTWTRQGDALQLPDAGFEDICILDSETLLVAGDTRPDGTYNVYKSIDGGNDWVRINSESLVDVNYNGLFTLGKDHV